MTRSECVVCEGNYQKKKKNAREREEGKDGFRGEKRVRETERERE